MSQEATLERLETLRAMCSRIIEHNAAGDTAGVDNVASGMQYQIEAWCKYLQGRKPDLRGNP